MTPAGTVAILHTFGSAGDGEVPLSGPLNVNGKLYGTTYEGGIHSDGVVYRVGTKGSYKVLYAFQGGEYDGSNPIGGLVELNGTLYGTTYQGGAANDGIVFSVSPRGKEQVLRSFSGSDGANPAASLVFVNGTLYGTTYQGGAQAPDSLSCHRGRKRRNFTVLEVGVTA